MNEFYFLPQKFTSVHLACSCKHVTQVRAALGISDLDSVPITPRAFQVFQLCWLLQAAQTYRRSKEQLAAKGKVIDLFLAVAQNIS